MAALFFVSLAIVVYTYLGYPLCLALLGKTRGRPVAKGPLQPTVSVLVAACNEEQAIVRRIENLLAQEYPAGRLEIVVVSDGSSDRTAELARGVAGEGIQVLELAQRQGKAAALNAAAARAGGELLLFCDARQSFDADAVAQLAANFRDPTVGCVSGELMLHRSGSDGIQVEMGAYWRYEKWIRRAESATGSVVGATGAIYAMRRALYRDLPQGVLLDDVMTPMRVVLQGYRSVFDGSARAHDQVSSRVGEEWLRKVRTLAGNWQLMSLEPSLLLPWRNPCCWRFISHKVLRLVVPVALVLMALSAPLLEGPLFRAATWLQLFFYGLALLGGVAPAARRNRLVNVSYFFVVLNAGALAGFWCWATGRSGTAWRPAYAKGGR